MEDREAVTATDPVLDVRELSKTFGRRSVFMNVSFALRPGEIVGVTGENGAGKTTLLRIIVGLLAPDRGTVRVSGRLGYCPQDLAIFETLTVRENFAYFAAAYGLDKPGRRDAWAETMGCLLEDFRFGQYADAPVSTLSGGTKQKLNFSLSVLHGPDLLILDEPYSGFDWETYLHFWDYARGFREQGRTVLIVSHFVYDRSKFDRVYELGGRGLRCG
jgi:ABC-type multidrug transport system ATPase subunit